MYPDPEGVADALLVLITPAMGVRARYYRPFAAALRAAGLAVAVADLRGTGESTPKPSRACRYGYPELAADVGAVLAALKSRRDGRRTLLLGHSLGGQAALLHLALHGEHDVDGLALVAVGVPWWRSYPGLRGYGVLPYTQGIAATARLLGVWPGWGFGGRQARGVIRDWAYTARTGRFPQLDGVDAEAAVRALRTPSSRSASTTTSTPRTRPSTTCARSWLRRPSRASATRRRRPAPRWTTSPGYARAPRWRPGWPASPPTCRPADPGGTRHRAGRPVGAAPPVT